MLNGTGVVDFASKVEWLLRPQGDKFIVMIEFYRKW